MICFRIMGWTTESVVGLHMQYEGKRQVKDDCKALA